MVSELALIWRTAYCCAQSMLLHPRYELPMSVIRLRSVEAANAAVADFKAHAPVST